MVWGFEPNVGTLVASARLQLPADFSDAADGFTLTACNARLWLFGGVFHSPSHIWSFNEGAGWQRAGRVPPEHERWCHCTVAWGSALYVLGGSSIDDDLTTPTGSAVCLDLEAWEWRALPDMPVPVALAAAAVLGTKIYVTGGSGNNDNAVATVQCFNLLTETWSCLSPLTKPREGHAMTVAPTSAGRTLVVVEKGSDDPVEIFDQLQKTWCAARTGRSAVVGKGGCALVTLPRNAGMWTFSITRLGGNNKLLAARVLWDQDNCTPATPSITTSAGQEDCAQHIAASLFPLAADCFQQ